MNLVNGLVPTKLEKYSGLCCQSNNSYQEAKICLHNGQEDHFFRFFEQVDSVLNDRPRIHRNNCWVNLAVIYTEKVTFGESGMNKFGGNFLPCYMLLC